MPNITFSEWLTENGYDAEGFQHEITGRMWVRIGREAMPENELFKTKYATLHRKYHFSSNKK